MKDRASEFRPLVVWALERLGLEDWTIELSVSDAVPPWCDAAQACDSVALCGIHAQYNIARVWVSPEKVADPSNCNHSIEHHVLHELGHVLACEMGWEDPSVAAPRRHEATWNNLASALLLAWEADNG